MLRHERSLKASPIAGIHRIEVLLQPEKMRLFTIKTPKIGVLTAKKVLAFARAVGIMDLVQLERRCSQ